LKTPIKEIEAIQASLHALWIFDLLLYGDQIIQENGLVLPRDEILKYAFVLRPLAEINGQATHPITQQSYIKLWENFDQSRQPLKRVAFEFD